MNEPLEDAYFNWLCAKVVRVDEPQSNNYWNLLQKLHRTEFVWLLSGDDNRAEDGKELRREFLIAADIPDYPEWRTVIGCSVLEMFIAFARRAEFQTDMPAWKWFWEFVDNLGLKRFDDRGRFDGFGVESILHTFIWRMYNQNGIGGMFPIVNPISDQREIEVWNQFCEYLVDQDRMP